MTHRHLLALCLFAVVSLLACGTADGKGRGGAGGNAGSGGVGGLGGTAGAGGTGGGSGGREFQGVVLTLAGIAFDDYIRDFVGAAAIDESGAIVATDSAVVEADGSFELIFDVEPGPGYRVRYFADANGSGSCDRSTEADADGIWLASIGVLDDDTTVGLRYGESTVANPAADACDGLPTAADVDAR